MAAETGRSSSAGGRRRRRQSGQVSRHARWKRCPQGSRFTTDSGSNRARHTRQSPPRRRPNRDARNLLRNRSARVGPDGGVIDTTGRWWSSAARPSQSHGDGAARPRNTSAARTSPARIATDAAVLYRTNPIRLSLGAGMLEMPIVAGRSVAEFPNSSSCWIWG
nr:unnamed protein product [Digitaria exilis]